MKPLEKIVELLNEHKASFDISQHKPVTTSKQALEVTGFSLHQAAKSILFKINGEYVIIVLRGDKLADFKKIRDIFDTRKSRLAKPDEVLAVMGVEIGACYPFGSIAGVKMLVDETLATNETISFSPGVHDKHIQMPWKDYERVVKPELVDIIKH